MFDLNLVRPFLSVYKLGTITKAAESLELTQPAVSSAIKRFENVLGYPLFIRMGRKIEPTPNAHQLASQLSMALELMDGAVASEQKMIVYAGINAISMLPEMPNIQLYESPKAEQDVLQDIKLNKVDLVIDYNLPRDSGLNFEPAFTDELVLMCDKNHPTIQDEITMQQYLEAEHVTLKLYRQNSQIVDFLAGKSLSRKVAIEVGNMTNIIISTQGTNYVAAIAKSMASIAEQLGLKIIQPPFYMRKVNFEFTYHKKYQNNATHKALREQLKVLLNKPN
ncbi:LysR family transcriptional regulator [Vibrio ezurae]|uniref:Putative LysR family transcriptional regulator n=1 Tax=Vibrio ezurae NBRC 102218 TaxID=1219080 RepID=U3CJ67_9VIBR|nr:LysR family transcriptional regulator [Vibrio ezurae]GAD81199.1 putative LysR family transcriptional regulator [Vibrio ezurae NBRC 102218]